MLLAIPGYYDGQQIVLNENIKLTCGQQVIVTLIKSDNECDNDISQKERDEAFERLEHWRVSNKDTWGTDFDWKKEVQEALNEKYDLVD